MPSNKRKYGIRNLLSAILFSLAFIPYTLYSQSGSDSLKKHESGFDTIPVILKEGEIISKSLRIKNNSGSPLIFSINLSFPQGWKTLNSKDKIFDLEAGDSIFIPVRIIPIGKIRGNIKYRIGAYVLRKDSTPVASASFFVIREKVNNWEIRSGPNDKIYIRNKSNTEKFYVQVVNTGNEEQDIVVDFENVRNDIVITDTTGRILNKSMKEIRLEPNHDTTFHYKAKYIPGMRNIRPIDSETYNPDHSNEVKSYSLFVRSAEPRLKGGRRIQKVKKIDFVKLPGQYRANPYGFSYVPLIAEMNVSNLLGGQPILNLNFRGNTTLPNGGALNYYSQFFFSNYFYTNSYFSGSYHYIGYFDEKYMVELGDVGGIGGGTYVNPGRGVTASYRFLPEHRAGVFYTRSPKLFSASDHEGYGFLYTYTPRNGSVNAGYSGVDNKLNKLHSDYINANGSYRFLKRHSVSAGGMYAMHNSYAPSVPYARQGFLAYGGYTGTFLEENKLRSNIFISHISPGYEIYNKGTTWLGNHSSSYKLNRKWTLQMNNNYNNRKYIPELSAFKGFQNTSYGNLINGTYRKDLYYIGPGLFYNANEISGQRFHSRGASINFGMFNQETSTLISNSMMAGYSRALEQKPIAYDYFFFQWFSMFKYRVIGASARYTYGNIMVYDTAFLRFSSYPQSLSLAFSYQYQFRDPHFILQNYASYSYISNFRRMNIGYTPELYYYSNSGWRIRLSTGFYLSRSDASGEGIYVDNSGADTGEPRPVFSKSVQINVGVRKEFGIPIPFAKKKFHSIDFIAFIDMNGNNKKDAEEYPLENIVIKMGDWEVLTGEKGKASIKNVPRESYRIVAFSLDDLGGFFPNMQEELIVDKDHLNGDAIAVPFVKGIKIFGKVVVDREKIPGEEALPLDLSGIKITAENGKPIFTLTSNDGSFSFYVPYGKYNLKMDEQVLGDRFRILQNDIELVIDKSTENLFITFYVVERRRKINISKRSSEPAAEPAPAPVPTPTADEKTQDDLVVTNTDKNFNTDQGQNIDKGFYVVVGSFKSNANAENQRQVYIQKGHTGCQLVLNNVTGNTYVFVSKHATKEEAIAELRKARAGDFPNAWIMELK